MIDERGHLKCEIFEYELELKHYEQRVRELKIMIEKKKKELEELKMNTNKAVENKLKQQLVSDLKSKNWYVDMREFVYPMLEVVDESTVKIEGVEYKKVKHEMKKHYKAHLTEKLVYKGDFYIFDYGIWHYYDENLKIHSVEDTKLVEELTQAYKEYKNEND